MGKSKLEDQLNAVIGSFRSEIATIRTGRAAASLVENIKVEAYPGTPMMAVKELASVSVPEPRLIIIDPWDKATLPKIEKAIQTAPGLGISPVVDQQILRLPLPTLSEERRRETVKLLRSVIEKYRQQVRDIRQDWMRELEGQEKNGGLSEDEKFAEKKRIEETVKKINNELERLSQDKEADILRI